MSIDLEVEEVSSGEVQYFQDSSKTSKDEIGFWRGIGFGVGEHEIESDPFPVSRSEGWKYAARKSGGSDADQAVLENFTSLKPSVQNYFLEMYKQGFVGQNPDGTYFSNETPKGLKANLDTVKGVVYAASLDKQLVEDGTFQYYEGQKKRFEDADYSVPGFIGNIVGQTIDWGSEPQSILELLGFGSKYKGVKGFLETTTKETALVGLSESIKTFKQDGREDFLLAYENWKRSQDVPYFHKDIGAEVQRDVATTAAISGVAAGTLETTVKYAAPRFHTLVSGISDKIEDLFSGPSVFGDSPELHNTNIEQARSQIDAGEPIDIPVTDDKGVPKETEINLPDSGAEVKGLDELNQDIENMEIDENDPTGGLKELEEFSQTLEDDIETQNLERELGDAVVSTTETPTVKPEAARRHPAISYTHEDGREVNLTKGDYNALKAYQKNVRAGKNPTKKQMDTYLKHEKFYDENEDMFAKESTFDTYAKQQEGDKYADMSAEDLAELERQGKVAPTDLQDPNTLFAKFADNLAAGTVAGIEEDEEGNITFDPVKFVAGLGGYTAAKEILKAGAKHPKIVGKVNEWLDDIHEEVARAAGGGTPPGVKVAYHATKAKFDTKDIKPSSTGNLGSAIYFSFDKEYVSKYGENLHEVGLDRANILDLSDREVVDPLYKEWLGVEDIKSVKKDYNHYMQQIMSKGETVSDVANSQNDFNTFLASKGYDGTTVKRPGQTGSEIAIFNLDSIDFKKGLLERKSLDILKEENKATLPKIRTNKIFLNDVGVMPKEINQDLNKIIDTPKEAELPFETVKLSDIVPTQKNVTVPNLEKVKGVTDVAEDIIVAEVDGKYYVVDGHHRISNNILEGEEVVEAKVYRKVDDRKPLKVRLSGDNLLEAEDLIEDLQDVNAKIDDKGYVTLYHRTSKEAADKIVKSKKMTSKEPGLFFSTAKEGQAEGYGEAVIKVEVPVEDIHLDDIFSNEAHVTIEHKRFTKEAKDISKYNPVKETK